MSLKSTILDYLKSEYPRIVHKGEIGKLAVNKWGYENENAGRRCRELENDKWIIKIPNEKGEAMYRYNAGKESFENRRKETGNLINKSVSETIQILIDHKAKLAESQRIKELQTSLF